jgi:hypothetical protein
MPKQCSCCDSNAVLSLCFLTSTVGKPDRLQKCSESTALCKRCMEDQLVQWALTMPPPVLARLIAAYTAIVSHCEACTGQCAGRKGER